MPEADLPPEVIRVAELLAWGRTRVPGDEARRECELLLGHALQRDRAWLFAHANEAIDATQRERFAQLIDERRRGMPVAYLLGHWGFWTLDLRVSADTLIPRPETELLVEAALAHLPTDASLRLADLGTGSGAIALALARERPRAQVIATDQSEGALTIARDNAQRNEIANVEFRRGSWYEPLEGERFDLIASNPPYVADGDPHVAQGDLRFEPLSALTSGADGLDAIRTLAREACAHLNPGGWLLIEHGFAQGEPVRELLTAAGLESVETLRDLEGRERMTLGKSS